jgi:hypothetical protein
MLQPQASGLSPRRESICVKALALVAMLLCSSEFAAAEEAAAPPAKMVKAAHSGPLRIVPSRLSQTPSHKASPLSPSASAPEQFLPPQEVYASFPDRPGVAAPAAQPLPSACQARLAKFAAFKPLPVLAGPGECGAVDAVILENVILPDQTKVAVTPPATLRCTMAEAVATWVREDVAPAALKYGAPLRGLDNFDSYECRTRNRVSGAPLSEHGRANALDVRAFRLANGEAIGLTDVNVAKDWRERLRASVCARFSTVLGPGSDGYHEEHIHLDLAERRGGYKMCEWDVREPTRQAAGTELRGDAAVPLSEPIPLPRPRPMAANR